MYVQSQDIIPRARNIYSGEVVKLWQSKITRLKPGLQISIFKKNSPLPYHFPDKTMLDLWLMKVTVINKSVALTDAAVVGVISWEVYLEMVD